MIRWLGFIDFGVGSVTTVVVVTSPQWVQPLLGRRLRVFPPRVRNEYWVEPGHVETDDPYTDTREG